MSAQISFKSTNQKDIGFFMEDIQYRDIPEIWFYSNNCKNIIVFLFWILGLKPKI